MIAVIILAAGKSERMGRPKASLAIGDSTFLETILDRYDDPGIGRIVVVGRAGAEPLRFDPGEGKVGAVTNPDPRGDQLSSLLAGIDAVEPSGPAAVIVHPVDHPLVSRATIATILAAALRAPGTVIVPLCGGRRGHPVLFPRELFPALRNVPPGGGARAVIRDPRTRLLEIETGDGGILADIDTPEDYERLR